MPAVPRRRNTGGSANAQNIKVAVRVRGGLTASEANRALKVRGQELSVMGAGPSGSPMDFAFDYCYGPDATQLEVYDDIGGQILDHAFEGYNGTIFAYGQTGSGKSHSIMGAPGQEGIVPRLAVELFERISNFTSERASFEVTATYAELYNEVICDLLTPGNTGLKIRQHLSTGIYVENLTEVQVQSHEEIERLIAEGNKARQVAATRMNDRSSRSHAIFTIMLRQTLSEGEGTIRKLSAKVNLVDLAGSERADMTADAKQMQEGAAINKSLSALGNVINALTEGPSGGKAKAGTARKGAASARAGGTGTAAGAANSYVPYRSSKLTRLLEESLGGNTVTVMLATISAEERNLRETIATLKYAQRAKKITNVKSKNEAKEEKRKIRELTAEIERLTSLMGSQSQQQPTGARSSGSSDGGEHTSAAVAELRMELEKAREEASLANASSLAGNAKARELKAELDASQVSVEDLEGRLRKQASELNALQGAHRSAELEAQHLRQSLSQEKQHQADDSNKMASLAEELAATRRQLQNAHRHTAEAKEEAAAAVAQMRAAEGQLMAAQAQLAAHASLHDDDRRDREASQELLGAASRDKRAQAELMDRNLAAFEAVLKQKDAQIQQLNDRLTTAKAQEDRTDPRRALSHGEAKKKAKKARRAALAAAEHGVVGVGDEAPGGAMDAMLSDGRRHRPMENDLRSLRAVKNAGFQLRPREGKAERGHVGMKAGRA